SATPNVSLLACAAARYGPRVAMSRRAFVGGLAAALLAGPGLAQGQEPARLRGWRWQGGVARSATSAEGATTIRAPYDVNTVGLSLPGNTGGLSLPRQGAGLRLRASADGSVWSPWQAVTWHEAHGRT